MKNTIDNQEKHVQEIKKIVGENELEMFVKTTKTMNPEAYFLVCLVDGNRIEYNVTGTPKKVVELKHRIRDLFFA